MEVSVFSILDVYHIKSYTIARNVIVNRIFEIVNILKEMLFKAANIFQYFNVYTNVSKYIRNIIYGES